MMASKSIINIMAYIMELITFMIFFSGGSDRSKIELKEILYKKNNTRYFIYGLVLLLILCAATAIFFTFLNHIFFEKQTTFNVTISTEEVRVLTHDIPMTRWPVENIQLSKSCPDEKDDIQYENFSGAISINPSVEFILTRIATGPLSVEMRSIDTKKSVGSLYDNEDEEIESLSNCAFFNIKNIPGRVKSGKTIVFPITGDIVAGQEIKFLTQLKTPILKNGKITILDKEFLTNKDYSIGPFNLEAGDSFKIQQTSAPSQGIALIGLEPAINLVYRAKGLRGIIKRYRSENYEIRNSLWSKLYNDEALSITWAMIIILFGIIQASLRYMVN